MESSLNYDADATKQRNKPLVIRYSVYYYLMILYCFRNKAPLCICLCKIVINESCPYLSGCFCVNV